MQYKPKTAFTVPLILLVPTYTKINGVEKKTYPAVENGIRFNGSFKTYLGTETTVNNLYTIIDTAEVETYYSPLFQANCVVVLADNNEKYEIKGKPENINMANQFCKFKVEHVKGGA